MKAKILLNKKLEMGEKIISVILIVLLTIVDIITIGINCIAVFANEAEPVTVKTEITEEVYKGYLYYCANSTQPRETQYQEKATISVNKHDEVDNITIANIKENYVSNPNENKEKGLYETNDSIYIKETLINKQDFIDVLGKSGEITIKDQNGKILSQINNVTQKEDEVIKVTYKNKEVSKLTIETTKPIHNGEISFVNNKAIKANTGYTKEEIKSFDALEEVVSINNKEETLKMNLLNPKAEAKIEISNTELSTLQKNENIQIKATLFTNKMEYDLYKNPYIEIIFPAEMSVDVKSINPLNANNLEVVSATYDKEEQKEAVIKLQLNGEELDYEDTVSKGIQIIITADISIDKLTQTQKKEIIMKYTNENRPNEVNETKKEITLKSKDGALLINKVSNYNENGDTLEIISDKSQIGNLDAYSEKRIANMDYYLINNYENNMDDVVIIGRLPSSGAYQENGKTDEVTIGEKLASNIELSKEGADIYYSEDETATKNSNTWTQQVQDISKIKSFKIEYKENAVKPQEIVKMSYSVEIPENLDNNQTMANNVQVLYRQELNEMEITSTNILQTPIVEFSKVNTVQNEAKINNNVDVQMAVVSNGKVLNNGEEIKEGQTVRYTLQITNNNQQPINNLKMVATHTNVIYYGVQVRPGHNGNTFECENEQEDLSNKEITVERINPGETVTLQYQIVASKEVEEGTSTSGTIVLTGENMAETTINAYTNPIKQGKLRLKIINTYPIGTIVYSNNFAYPIELHVENITKEDLSNVEVQINFPELIQFRGEENYSAAPENIQTTLTKLSEQNFKVDMPLLPAGQEATLYMLTGTRKMDTSLEKQTIYFSYSANVDNETYISNQMDQDIFQDEISLEVNQLGSIEGEYVKTGDELTYTTEIINKGTVGKVINIIDELPRGVNANSAYLIRSSQQEEMNVINSSYVSKELEINAKETLILVINTTIDASLIDGDSIINIVKVSDTESNEVIYKVQRTEADLPEMLDPNEGKDFGNDDDDEDQDLDDDEDDDYDPDNPDPDNPDPDNPDPDNPTEPTEPDEPEVIKKNISGMVWLDENEDGKKDNSEEKIPDMEVYLFNQKNGNAIAQTKTDEKGKYQFKDLPQGKYFVVFNYDNARYKITAFKKENVNTSNNSDVVEEEIRVIKNKKVAITEELELDDIDIVNIDAGFVKTQIFDLKLNKTIKRVVVQNQKGTTVTDFASSKLAKIEIGSNEIQGSIVTVEYQIEVANEGEVLGYATEIIDNIPDGFQFDEDENPKWYKTENGKIATKQLTNVAINPGEGKIITLILSKKMTNSNSGTSTNVAEINKQSNELSIKDIDSTPGNSNAGEDDISSAELIISIKTGNYLLNITFIIAITIMFAVGVYLIYKKVFVKGDA